MYDSLAPVTRATMFVGPLSTMVMMLSAIAEGDVAIPPLCHVRRDTIRQIASFVRGRLRETIVVRGRLSPLARISSHDEISQAYVRADRSRMNWSNQAGMPSSWNSYSPPALRQPFTIW